MRARQILMGIAAFCLFLAFALSLGASFGPITLVSFVLLGAMFAVIAFAAS